MKKIFCLLFSLIVILLCSSCEQNNNSTIINSVKDTEEKIQNRIEYVNDRYIYSPASINKRQVMIQYDVIDKTTMVACPDPLCDHGESCISSGFKNYSVTDGFIYFEHDVSKERGFEVKFYVYDLANNEIYYLVTGTQVSAITTIGDYDFFTMGSYEYDEDGNIKSESFYEYRFDRKTAKVEKISEEAFSSFLTAEQFDNKTITWKVMGTRICFSTDYDFQNKQELSRIETEKEGKYTYTTTNKFEYGTWPTVTRTDNETGEEVVLFEDVTMFRSDTDEKNCFFYIPAEYAWQEIAGKTVWALKKIDGVLVYVNAEDPTITKEYIIADIAGENFVLGGVRYEAKNSRTVGSYVGMTSYVQKYNDAGEKEFSASALFIVNTETLEAFPIVCDVSLK